MLENIRAKIKTGGAAYEFDKEINCEGFSARVTADNERVTLEIEPVGEIIFDEIKLTADTPVTDDDRVF